MGPMVPLKSVLPAGPVKSMMPVRIKSAAGGSCSHWCQGHSEAEAGTVGLLRGVSIITLSSLNTKPVLGVAVDTNVTVVGLRADQAFLKSE